MNGLKLYRNEAAVTMEGNFEEMNIGILNALEKYGLLKAREEYAKGGCDL